MTPNQKLSIAGTFGILEGGASPAYYTIFQGGDQVADVTYTLPIDAGSSGQVLSTNGAGVLSWVGNVDLPDGGYFKSLYTSYHDFSLDATPFTGRFQEYPYDGWTYRSAHLVRNQTDKVWASGSHQEYGVQFLSLFIDTKDYSGVIPSHAINAEVYGAGTNTVQYLDLTAIGVQALGNTANGRNVALMVGDARQYGTSGGTGLELWVHNPSTSPSQCNGLAGGQFVIDAAKGAWNAAGGGRPYYGVEIVCLSNPIKSAFQARSNSSSSHFAYGLDLSNSYISNAAIKMGMSASYNNGTIIEYDANDYTVFDRTNNRYLFVIGGSITGYIDATGFHNGSP